MSIDLTVWRDIPALLEATDYFSEQELYSLHGFIGGLLGVKQAEPATDQDGQPLKVTVLARVILDEDGDLHHVQLGFLPEGCERGLMLSLPDSAYRPADNLIEADPPRLVALAKIIWLHARRTIKERIEEYRTGV